MQEIRGDAKNIRSLLSNVKFGIDYYQREYRWETKQITDLLKDLTEKFLDSHEDGNARTAVSGYGRYFLGSIIISDRDGKKFLIDGQQRLTSITLLIISLYHRLSDEGDKGTIAPLIFSAQYGRRSFNLDVEARAECMNALFTDAAWNNDSNDESVTNIHNRFRDIEDNLPEEVCNQENSLPHFVDWLTENVYFVEITAYSDADAYTIFETMNDRGLSLTPVEMLKGYLLANITDPSVRNSANIIWQERISVLRKIDKDADAEAIKSWLRSQYAVSMRERKRGAVPLDFDLIGTEFHRWVRDHGDELNLESRRGGDSFFGFIKDDFKFYTHWYIEIRKAEKEFSPQFDAVYRNAQNGFSLQPPILLASLLKTDSEEEIIRKIRVGAAFIDNWVARRVWNWTSIAYSTIRHRMYQLILEIRGKKTRDLADILCGILNEPGGFEGDFWLHQQNRNKIHNMLARMTEYVETESGENSKYLEYVQRGGRSGYEIEHIWANQYDRHVDEFNSENEFDRYRNRIGGLLLLPKKFNASFGKMPYAEKRAHYYGQNLLAKTLVETTYSNNPGFVRFNKASGLPFRPHAEFKRADLDARQELYRQLADMIWNPDVLRREAES